MGQTNEIAIQILYDQYGEENVELLDGNMARTPEGIVTLIAKTNPRHEIAAELYAIGMRQNEIEMLLKRNKDNPSSGYYSRILKNPMVMARREEYAKEIAEQAKNRLTGVVVKAAENIAAAVEGGHLPSSLQVLKAADVINPVQKTQKEIKVSFGTWLEEGKAKSDKAKDVTEEGEIVSEPSCTPDTQQIAICADDMERSDTGETLDSNLFERDENG